MMRLILALTGALILGAAVGIAVPKLWHLPQTFSECMMDRMKGQTGTMFPTVYLFCQSHAEMTDRDVGLDEWIPVKRPNP